MPETRIPDLTPERLATKIQDAIREPLQEETGLPSDHAKRGEARQSVIKLGAFKPSSSAKAEELLKKAQQTSRRYRKWPRTLFRKQSRIDDLILGILKFVVGYAKKIDGVLRGHDKALRKVGSAAGVLHLSVTDLQREFHRLSQQLQQHREQVSRIHLLQAQMETQARQVEQLGAQLGHLRRELRQLRDERALADTSDRKAPGDPAKSVERLGVDSLYVSFENHFRGSETLIRERAQVYLPFVDRVKEATSGLPALDLGCGRGEWLSILKERGITGMGVDGNPTMVDESRRKGVQAACGDAVGYLQTLPPSSQSLVTAFHLVEHLPPDRLLALLQEVSRVLAPGGVAIFETPNPANVLVSTFSFHFDPTHLRPLPAPLMKFLCESSGFARAEILELHPAAVSDQVPVEGAPALAERFNQLFYGPQDFATVAWASSK